MRARAIAAGLLACLGVASVSGQSATQSPPPTFKAEVEYIEVDTLVLDKDGTFVRDLTQQDFRIFEDGRPQKISTFALVDIANPSVASAQSAAAPVDTDVQSNEQPFDGRVYVLILDDLHTQFSRMPRAQAAARQFIERSLGANDLMAVVSTGARAQDAQDFTNKKPLLLAAVDQIAGQKMDSPTVAQVTGFGAASLPRPPGSAIGDNDSIERVQRAQMALNALRRVGEWFAGVRGRRKTMLLFSEGIDFDFMSAGDGRGAVVYRAFLDTLAATARSNVSIYAIDPRGLGLASDDTISLATLDGKSGWLNAPPTGGNSPASPSTPPVSSVIGQLNDELRTSQRNLQSLAEETGGSAAMNQNDYSGFFTRIVRDSSSYYVLAYYPPSTKQDNKLRRIEVKVARPGLTVRARRGYVPRKANSSEPGDAKNAKATTAPAMPPDLRDALASPLPVSGLSMRVSAAPFMGTASNASVVVIVEMLGRDLTLEANNKVQVSFQASDVVTNKVQGARNLAITLDLQPDTRARVEQTGIRLLNRMELLPGRYQLRVAARDPVKANVGAVTYDLEVPDFAKVPVGLSGLMVTSLAGAAMFTPRADEQLKDVLPAPPIALRTFAQNDELALFAEAYDQSGSGDHDLTLVTSVLDGNGRVVYNTEETIDSSDLDAVKRSHEYSVRIPLGDLAPGRYVLKLEAWSSVGNMPPASRQIGFTVTPPERRK